jgi:carboxylesterase
MSLKTHPLDCSDTHPACRDLRSESRDSGVTDPGNLPFMLCPQQATTAVLLVHGFTGTPWEMRPLADYLAEAGIASLSVRLPGHGTTPEDLSGRRWQEWLHSVAHGHQLLGKEFTSVFGMGMSTGCLLLLALAATERLNGLVLFSPYLRILHTLAPHAGWVRWLRPYYLKPSAEEFQLRYYDRKPVAGIHQINLLIKSLRRQLADVCCPVMAFNGLDDRTVDAMSSVELMRLLNSKVKIHGMYGPEVSHVLTLEGNPCRGSMFAQTAHFVQEIDKSISPRRTR